MHAAEPRSFWAATPANPAPGSPPRSPPDFARPTFDVESAGVVTTPAVAFLTRTHGFQAGAVISASHNPWQDNGIKLFGADGFKLADAVELAMEEEILHHASKIEAPDPASLPLVEDNPAYQSEYIQFLIDCVPGLSIAGLRIVADCANGAAAAIAPELFSRLNANVTPTSPSSTPRPTAATSTTTAARFIPTLSPRK